MNKVCKEYISDAKKFFPIMGKSERAYLRGIVSQLEDCIEREAITTKQELYTKYRQPYELANDYYSRFETDEIVKKIRISKYIKVFISAIILFLLIAASIFIINTNILRDSYNREEIVGYNQTNTNQYENKDKEHSYIKSDNYDSIIESENEEIIEEEEIIE